MATQRQKIIWTALPNGVANGVLRLSVFIAPQLSNPAGTPKLPLDEDHYPDFVDWAATVRRRVSFSVEFEGAGTFAEQGSAADPAQSPPRYGLRRIYPPPLKRVERPWREVFATAPGAKLRPVVRSFEEGPKSTRNVAIVPFATREVLEVVNNQYAALLSSNVQDEGERLVPPPTPAPGPMPMPPQPMPASTPPPPPEVSRSIREMSKGSSAFVESLRSQFTGLGELETVFADITRRIVDISNEQPVPDVTVAPKGADQDAWSLGLAYYYHQTLSDATSPALDGGDTPPDESSPRAERVSLAAALAPMEIEFHETVAAVGSHPILMRHLGLVVDLEIPIPAGLPAGGRGRVRVKPAWRPSPNVVTEDVTPWTVYNFTGSLFQAAPRDAESDIYHGLLNLTVRDPETGKLRFHLEQIDALNEALKLVGYVLAVQNETSALGEIFSSPRGGGIALIRDRMHERLRDRLRRADELVTLMKSPGPSDDLIFYAEDLTRGYRMDIGRDGSWLSLSERRGTYHFLARRVDEKPGVEEGWVATSAVHVNTGPGGKDKIAMHDTVCKWEGWSLAAPRPGKPIESQTLAGRSPGPPEDKVTFTTDFVPRARSLPSLRYGQPYSVRVRVTDLAGNSLAPDDPVGNDPHAIAGPIPYFRFDPVPSPDIIPRVEPDAAHGESVYTIVIRSNYDTPCPEIAERHLAPPKASELLAETHGFLDDDGRVDEDAYRTLVKYDGEAPAVEPKKKYQVPYLPDPLAGGAHLHGLPGAPPDPQRVDFLPADSELRRRKWPKAKPWRMLVMETPGSPIPADEEPPQFRPPEFGGENDGGLLTVFLPKAEVTTVSLNSTLLKADLGVMALWDFIQRTFPNNSDLFEAHILRRSHWMFNPKREVRLVHAVQQPLFPPKFEGDSPQRPLPDEQCVKIQKRAEDTHALLSASMKMPGRSARSFEVIGAWTEFLDAGETFKQGPGSSVAFGGELEQRDHMLAVGGRHEFGDTKHRRVTYTVIAKTRFREFLKITDEEISSGSKPVTRESRRATVHVPNSAVPPPPEVLYAVPTFGWSAQRRETATISRARGAGGLRIYLNRPWYRTGEDELLGVIVPEGGMPAPMETQVSRWGRDPLSRLAGPDRPLAAADFKGEIKSRRNFNWEVAGGMVTVLGYPVSFDAERRLWFCDIEIDPGQSYFPFVRLALTRYQPYSVGPTEENPANLFLSPVVLSDFCQLTPERHASVVIDTTSPGHLLRIRLAGRALVRENKVTVAVERGNPDYEGEIRWEQATDPQALMFREDAGGPHWALEDLSIPFGTGPLRVLFTESEEHEADKPDDPAGGAQSAARIVYAGVVYL